jgi:phage shock protein PspC (stress-responsive transcriptional regulator)
MKKTLTVNLGGTVFHIDEDAYLLLEKYLANLRIHFRKDEGADEIMSDFEMRIAEILRERIRLGYEVISIGQVEAVIKQLGQVEDIFGEDATQPEDTDHEPSARQNSEPVYKRFFRNPDDRMLGGVCSGLAAYMGWDTTPVRLLLFFLTFFYGITIPIYCILWLVVPPARTATEKLQMRGESITLENIGKTVTDGFEKVSGHFKDYVSTEKSRTTLQRIADAFVEILGIFLKVAAILLGIVLFPVLLVLLFAFIVVIIALIAGGIGGSAGLLFGLTPLTEDFMLHGYPGWAWIVFSISGILLLALPVLAVLYTLCGKIFHFRPSPPALRLSLIILWFIALAANIFVLSRCGIFWELDYPWDFTV